MSFLKDSIVGFLGLGFRGLSFGLVFWVWLTRNLFAICICSFRSGAVYWPLILGLALTRMFMCCIERCTGNELGLRVLGLWGLLEASMPVDLVRRLT